MNRQSSHLAHWAQIATIAVVAACAPPSPYGPVPTDEQLAWQRMEINMFCHFGPNTFSGAEWGDGQEAEDIFAPRALDCAQWVDVAEQAGMRGIIVTAKHHDGFCLWPSGQSSHTVAQSTWRGGHGDVLAELRRAINASREGVKMGVYISPWDRNHPSYGTEQYNDIFDATLREVHQAYGPMFEQWFDGACGEGPNGRRQAYDWPRFMQTMHEVAPSAIVFSDVGPGCRWVGNEDGSAGQTCWSTLDTAGATPSEGKPAPEELNIGHRNGAAWVPAECDVSIRPGWFWHPNEKPKETAELMDIYMNSVGRNGLLLLNVPPDTSGHIPTEDSLRLVEFRRERDRLFSNDLVQGAHIKATHRLGHRYKPSNVSDTSYHTYWAARDSVATITIYFDSATEFNTIMIQEYIPLGQRVTKVELLGYNTLCTTVGYKRIVRIGDAPLKTDKVQLRLHADVPLIINRIAIYNYTR